MEYLVFFFALNVYAFSGIVYFYLGGKKVLIGKKKSRVATGYEIFM